MKADRLSPREHVTIVEVGPRDGLQNHARDFSVETKVGFIEALAETGLTCIETVAFVNPRAVPKMADAEAVMTGLHRRPGVRYMALVPNVKGLEGAISASVDSIGIFAAATESFSRANLNASIDQTFGRFADVMLRARQHGMWVRGYLSVAFHCPYSGNVSPEQVLPVLDRLRQLGCDELVLADTTGQAEPDRVRTLVEQASAVVPVASLALHLHDTRGLALDNVAAGYESGIRVFDGSAGGIGGCPFSPGAPGNVATESLVKFFDGQGISTGIDADKVHAAYQTWIGTVARQS
ncbi:MAG: hydroxymethylglutaryl-CoA lyase [Thermomicrobiales bacterium]